MADRMGVLHVFHPAAKAEDWRLIDAGIRVQAIKETDGNAGIVHYGTEVITDSARSLSALLGASPGASVCVNIVLDVVKLCFPELIADSDSRRRLKEMIPTWDVDIKHASNAGLFHDAHRRAGERLRLAGAE
jgi:malate dehydrogenase (quinone)